MLISGRSMQHNVVSYFKMLFYSRSVHGKGDDIGYRCICFFRRTIPLFPVPLHSVVCLYISVSRQNDKISILSGTNKSGQFLLQTILFIGRASICHKQETDKNTIHDNPLFISFAVLWYLFHKIRVTYGLY